jgi:hypothetical protein
MDPIRYENVAKIKPGMTRIEIEGLLGCPPGDYVSRPVEHNMVTILNADGTITKRWETLNGHPGGGGDHYPEWRGHHGWIGVEFVDNGTVRACALIEGRPIRSGLVSSLYRLLGTD